MLTRLYEASKQSPFRSPFIVAECQERELIKGRRIVAAASDEVIFGSQQFFLYCGIGGALSCGLTHLMVTPLDLIKCRLQTNAAKYKGVFHGWKITIAEEGVAGLARGWAPTLIGYSLQGFCKFGFYEYFKIIYAKAAGAQAAYDYRTFIYLAASASAEVIADVALSPWEASKVKMQTMEGYASTLRECIPKILAEDGIGGFYKSLVPLWCRQIPYTMMKFACFERTVELLYAHVVPKPREKCSKGEQLVVTFAAGYIAGVFCAIVSHPADTMVSKLNKEKGVSASEMYKRIGFGGLWNGLTTRIIMIGTLTGLQWFIYDGVKVWLKIPRPPPPELPVPKR